MPPATVPALDALLLQDRRIWRGRGDASLPAVSTGHATLDAALPAGGWPLGALTEVLVPCDGMGELSLVLPLLVRLTAEPREVVAIAAPYLVYPPALAAAGVDCRHMHRIQTRSEQDALWAAEQCLRSGAVAAVLCWPGKADDTALRRLQLAAEAGNAVGFIFRPGRFAARPSLASLRVQLVPAPGFDPDHDDPSALPAGPALPQLRVLKCRGGIAAAGRIEFDRAGRGAY